METLCFSCSIIPPLPSGRQSSSLPLTKIIQFDNKFTTTRTTLINPIVRIAAVATTSLETTSPNPSPPLPPLTKILTAESLQYESGFVGTPPAVARNGGEGVQNGMSYLTKILSSKVYDIAIETPLQYASKLSERLDVHVWLKREDLQPVSFSSKFINIICPCLLSDWFFPLFKSRSLAFLSSRIFQSLSNFIFITTTLEGLIPKFGDGYQFHSSTNGFCQERVGDEGKA